MHSGRKKLYSQPQLGLICPLRGFGFHFLGHPAFSACSSRLSSLMSISRISLVRHSRPGVVNFSSLLTVPLLLTRGQIRVHRPMWQIIGAYTETSHILPSPCCAWTTSSYRNIRPVAVERRGVLQHWDTGEGIGLDLLSYLSQLSPRGPKSEVSYTQAAVFYVDTDTLGLLSRKSLHKFLRSSHAHHITE